MNETVSTTAFPLRHLSVRVPWHDAGWAGTVCNAPDVGALKEYDRSSDAMRCMIWERPVQHSIRPDGTDGFLVPYYAMLNRAEEDSSLDCERFTAEAPEEH